MARRNRRNSRKSDERFGNQRSYNGGENGSSYFINDQIIKDVGSLNWEYPVGLKFYPDDLPNSVVTKGHSIPLLNLLSYYPTLSVGENAPLAPSAQLAKQIFNYIVRINAKSVSYEPIDLQLVLMATSQLHAFISWCKRVYRITQTYSFENRGIPKVLLYSMGIDIDDMYEHLPDYRAWLNVFINRTALLPMPKGLIFANRWNTLNSNVYVDENNGTGKEQLYMFNPPFFYKYDETSSDKGGCLMPVPIKRARVGQFTQWEQVVTSTTWARPWENSERPVTFDVIKSIGEELISPLLMSEDVARIQADIYHAYGAESMEMLSLLAEDERQDIVYDPEILMQIENSVVPDGITYEADGGGFGGTGSTPYYPPVTQVQSWGDPYLQASVKMRFSRDNLMGNLNLEEYSRGIKYLIDMVERSGEKLLNVHKEDVNAQDVMIMTRLIPAGNAVSYSVSHHICMDVQACGTEILERSEIYGLDDTGNVTSFGPISYIMYLGSTAQAGLSYFGQQGLRNNLVFHNRPEIRLFTASTDNDKPNKYVGSYFDLDKWTTINKQQLIRLHEVALMGQFAIPGYISPVSRR